MKMHEGSLCIAQRDIYDDNEDTTAWAKLRNTGGGEDENDVIHPEMQQWKRLQLLKRN